MSPRISTRLLATQSDERLLALIRQGHERAFEALVHRYHRPLLSYCRRLGLPEARAEDVLQQALLKSWIALSRGVEVHQLKAWLYRIAHNAAVNALRDAAHDPDGVADPSQFAGAGESELDRGIATRQALAEVAALPPLQREVIVRTAVAGHSHERVASDLGLSRGAVRGLAYRARATLRTAVTALTPPSLVQWLAGTCTPGAPASERLVELAAGGGTAGLGGLLVKGGVVAITAGTLITGAVVQVHRLARPAHPRPGVEVAVNAAAGDGGARSAEPHLRGLDGGAASAVVGPGPALRGSPHRRAVSAPSAGGPGGGAVREPLASVRDPAGGVRGHELSPRRPSEVGAGPGSAPSGWYAERRTATPRGEGGGHGDAGASGSPAQVGGFSQAASSAQAGRSSRGGEGERGGEPTRGGEPMQGGEPTQGSGSGPRDGGVRGAESSRSDGSAGGHSDGSGATAGSGSDGSSGGSGGNGAHEGSSQGGSSQGAVAQSDGSTGEAARLRGSPEGGEGPLDSGPATAPAPVGSTDSGD